MDERDTAIIAQVAAKAATEIVVAEIAVQGNDATTRAESWGNWYTLIGQRIIGTVKQVMAAQQPVTTAPPGPFPAAQAEPPAYVPMISNGAPQGPSCPQHGPMVPGPGQTKGKGPLWKCSMSKFDYNTKSEVGCGYVIWPADDRASV